MHGPKADWSPLKTVRNVKNNPRYLQIRQLKSFIMYLEYLKSLLCLKISNYHPYIENLYAPFKFDSETRGPEFLGSTQSICSCSRCGPVFP